MPSLRRRGLMAVGVLVVGFLAGGCSQKITVWRVPPFWSPELKSIVVVPFRNRTNVRGAGQVISDQLADALRFNGTYENVHRSSDLQVLLDEADRQALLTGKDANRVIERFKKRGEVQAILIGQVNTFSATSQSQRKKDPIPAYNQYTNTWYVAGYKEYVWSRHESNVSVTARLIAMDGTTLYSMPTPATGHAWAEGSPPKYDPYACRTAATRQAVSRMLWHFAIIKTEIKVDPKKVLQTATRFYDGEWKTTDKFRTTDEKGIIVLSLPPEADRNVFKLTVVRKGTEEDLITQKVTWTSKWSAYGHGWAFSPKDTAEKGGGPGTYTVKFYSGPKPVIRRDFTITN